MKEFGLIIIINNINSVLTDWFFYSRFFLSELVVNRILIVIIALLSIKYVRLFQLNNLHLIIVIIIMTIIIIMKLQKTGACKKSL